MSLTVTVQKGHDFSSGNVTRAALNAGAVPTVAVTGSVGTSELAAGSVTGTELKSSSTVDTDRAVATNHIQDDAVTTAKIADDAVDLDKLHYSSVKGAIIKTGDNAAADAIIPTVLEAKTIGNILIGDGIDLLSLGHETANEDETGALGDTTSAQPKSHVAIGVTTAVGTAQTTGVLLTLQNFAIKVAKLAKNIVAGDPTPGIIVYDGSGEASVLASTGTASKVLTTNNTTTPSFKERNTVVDISATIVEGAWMTGAHGIAIAVGTTNYPHLVAWYYECTTTEHGYVAGDRIYSWGKEYNPGSAMTHSIYVDGSNVGIYLNADIGRPYVFHKTTGTGLTADGEITAAFWKIVAVVSEN